MKEETSKVFHVVRTGAYIVLTCNVTISYYHCLQLFNALVHFPITILTHIGVISLDAVFILSVIVLTESRGRGIPPWICFLFGLGFTTWSNIRSALLENNWEGVAVGASTVCALLLIKVMLTWMESNKHLFNRRESTEQQKKPKLSDFIDRDVYKVSTEQYKPEPKAVNWKSPEPKKEIKVEDMSQPKVGPGNLIFLKHKGVI